MAQNQALTKAMQGLGFAIGYKEVTSKKALVTMTGRYSAVESFMEQYKNLAPHESENADEFERCLKDDSEDREEFCGGTFKSLQNDLKGNIDLDPFMREKEKLLSSGLLQKLQTAMRDAVPRRKRVMSEHDGEWSMDRQWELEPFSSTKKAMAQGRTLDIVCNFAVSCQASAKEINRYGAIAWGISDLIESAGIYTRVVCRYEIENVDRNKAETSTDTLIEIEVKKAGQYMPPKMLAAIFQSNFFRRPIFALIVAAADLNQKLVSHGLGRSKEQGFRVAFKEGALHLAPEAIKAYNDEIEREILKAVGAQPVAASA